MNLQDLHEYVTLIKDLVTIGAAVIAAFIAIKGYDTWKKQLRGKTEYELARRLLRGVYKVRDSIDIVRSRFISSSEMTQALREADLETKADHMLDSEQPPMQLSAVYQRRWKQVIAALREWEVDCLEAQVLWGPRIIDSVKPLRQHVYTLFASLETYLCYREEGLTQGDSAYADATKVVLHQRNDDAFEAEIQEAIEQLEKTLRPYLSLGLSTIGL